MRNVGGAGDGERSRRYPAARGTWDTGNIGWKMGGGRAHTTQPFRAAAETERGAAAHFTYTRERILSVVRHLVSVRLRA